MTKRQAAKNSPQYKYRGTFNYSKYQLS